MQPIRNNRTWNNRGTRSLHQLPMIKITSLKTLFKYNHLSHFSITIYSSLITFIEGWWSSFVFFSQIFLFLLMFYRGSLSYPFVYSSISSQRGMTINWRKHISYLANTLLLLRFRKNGVIGISLYCSSNVFWTLNSSLTRWFHFRAISQGFEGEERSAVWIISSAARSEPSRVAIMSVLSVVLSSNKMVLLSMILPKCFTKS